MPDDQAAAPDDTQRIVQGLLNQALAQPQAPTGARAQVAPASSIAGLLGGALGGGASGAVPMSADESDAAGRRALMNFGINLLANSGWSSQRRTGGQIFAGGLGAAQESMGQSEALTAARGQARQDYAAQQQALAIARVKEAIPLLKMQAGMATPNTLLGAGAGAGAGAAGGGRAPTASIGAVGDVPAEYMPFYQEASARTGIPVDVLIAQHKQESGFDPGATGKAGEIGIGQILPSTAAAPGFGMAGVDPKTLRDPRANINFSADYLRAHMPKDANTSDPAVIDAALKAYNGGGDPNYVANVRRYFPGAKPGAAPAATAASTPPASVPASTTAPAPRIAPDTASPDVAPTGGQMAGPGAPTGGAVRPPSPAVPGDVNAIIQGMTGAGANPTTLATGGPAGVPGGSPAMQVAAAGVPAQTGGLVVPAGVTPPPGVTPPAAPAGKQTFEQFQTQHPIPIDPSTYAVTPPDLAQAKAAQAEAARQLSLARSGVSGDPNKSLSDYNTATKAVNDLQLDAQKKSLELRQAAEKNALDTQRQLFDAEQLRLQQAELKAKELEQAAAEAERQRQAAVALKKQEGDQAIEQEKVRAGQTWHQKLQEQAAEYAQTNTIKPMAAASAKAHQMNLGLEQMLPVLQDLPPSGGALGAVLDKHPDLAPLFNSAGILNDKQADSVRLINGLVSNISTEMKPAGLGALREYEWDAFKAQLPSMLSTPAGQQKAVAFLMNMNNRIQAEHGWMNTYFSRKVPDETSNKPGATVPAHNLESDDPKESVQARMDRELGPIIPAYKGPLTASGQSQWEQSLPPGKPYYKVWAMPDPARPGQPLRDQSGNVRTTKTLEIRPWQ